MEGIIEDEVAESSDEDHVDLISNKPMVKKGLAATLAFLKGTGDLQQKEELTGRSKDNRDYDPSKDDSGAKIEYRDKLGQNKQESGHVILVR